MHRTNLCFCYLLLIQDSQQGFGPIFGGHNFGHFHLVSFYLFSFRYSPYHGVYCDIASCHLSGIWDSGFKPESAKGKRGGRGSTRTSEQSHFIFTVVLFFEIHLNITDKKLTFCEYCPKNNPNLLNSICLVCGPDMRKQQQNINRCIRCSHDRFAFYAEIQSVCSVM